MRRMSAARRERERLFTRPVARLVLAALAQGAPDPFRSSWIRGWIWHSRRRGEISETAFYREEVISYLTAHGFIRVVERRHTWWWYELTEQAICWLDWTGFDWKQRRAA